MGGQFPFMAGTAPAGVVRKPRTRAAPGLRPEALGPPARSWLTRAALRSAARRKARPGAGRKTPSWCVGRRGDPKRIAHLQGSCVVRRTIPLSRVTASPAPQRTGAIPRACFHGRVTGGLQAPLARNVRASAAHDLRISAYAGSPPEPVLGSRGARTRVRGRADEAGRSF